MGSQVWWTVSKSTYGIYHLKEGAQAHLRYIDESADILWSRDGDTAIASLIVYAKLPTDAERIYTDGSFQYWRGSCAVYNETTGCKESDSFECGNSTIAEYKGVIMALEMINKSESKSFIVFTDYLGSCFRAWAAQLGMDEYGPSWDFSSCYTEACTIRNMVKQLDPSIKVYFVHVPSGRVYGNCVADRLARKELGLH